VAAQVAHLQRSIGNRAMASMLAPRRDGRRVLRRHPVWKPANHLDNRFDAFVAALDQAVQDGATAALDPARLPDTDGYLRLWRDTALILRGAIDGTLDLNDPDDVAEVTAAQRFGPARYGYAVESLACGSAGLSAALPVGCSYQLQATRGMTRPDIVVTHATDGEIGWFDITSHASIGHIDRKTGNGWRTRPYVAEITYPVLDPTQIGTGNLGIGEAVARKNAIKRRKQDWENQIRATRRQFNHEWETREGEAQNKAGKQGAARASAAAVLGLFAATPIQTMSLLRALALSPKDFGFDQGGTKAAGEEMLREIFDV
jgi:hypothetical protein